MSVIYRVSIVTRGGTNFGIALAAPEAERFLADFERDCERGCPPDATYSYRDYPAAPFPANGRWAVLKAAVDLLDVSPIPPDQLEQLRQQCGQQGRAAAGGADVLPPGASGYPRY